MGILEALWLLYVDGYTFQHWTSAAWMLSVNGLIIANTALLIMHHAER